MGEVESWTRVAALSDIPPGSAVAIDVMGRALAVFRLDDGTVCVTDNICTHAFAVLTDGWFEDGVVECPLHAGQFDVRSGKGLCPPIDRDLRTYKVMVEGDVILISIPP